ncbi:MAG: hypothetical protein R3C44_16560 [Chloroflexota bacterium]
MAESVITDSRDRAQYLGEQLQEQARIVLDNGKEDISTATGNGNGSS